MDDHNACLEECLNLHDQLAAAKNEIERLSGKTGFCAECEEQARLLGMSGSREAKLIAELAAAKAKIERLREALIAQMKMRDMNHPTKLDEALCWRENDELADRLARAALDGGKA